MRERDRLATVKRRLHDRLLQRIDANGLAAARPVDRRLLVREEALAILREEGHLLPQGDLARVVNDVSVMAIQHKIWKLSLCDLRV
jgi:hypothetical protein